MNAITVENLTKLYRLYDKPANRLKEIILRKPFHRPFTALDGITFTVKKGETLGIIGENGAGKSTLLKILARTLYPSSGKLEINGTVSALLELGSGFHPEFTGLDNIYFYGSLLGIDKVLMEKKKKEIIEFSEIGDFINFPLKTYSSGMYVRLAFSVATAIDPDILIVDEALSVGDLHFQKKSTDKMLSFKEVGKTIVFCTHELYHIARLCHRVLWLKNGKIHMEGKPLDVIQEYETYQLGKNTEFPELDRDITPEIDKDTDKQLADKTTDNLNDKKPKIIFIKNVQLSPLQDIKSGNDLYIKIQMVANDDTIPYRVAVKIRTVGGLDIIGIGTNKIDPFYGSRTITLFFPKIQLRSGTFIIEVFAFDEEGVYWYDRKEALPITIPRESIEIGILDLPHEWIID